MGKSSGSAPQAVDPYTQAGAQYGLSTGTAQFNAGLNRTNQVNPLGSSSWNASYPTVSGGPAAPSATPQAGQRATATQGMPSYSGNGTPLTAPPGYSPNFGLGGGGAGQINVPGLGNISIPGGNSPYGFGGSQDPRGGAPTYTQTTSLQPWANQMLQSPINTSGLPGMPGGPSITQNLQDTQNAVYGQEMGYLQPQEQLAQEQQNSLLANEGATPGSAAYKTAQDQMNRNNTFQNQQAANAAILAGNQQQTNLFGLGTQGLQNQLAVRNAPINEYQALSGGGGASANATTPDISGAFNQQLQSQLANYNAGVASNNATTGDLTGLASSYLMYLALA